MKVILYEMKKLWNWKILGIIGIVCALFFFLFMSYHITFYKRGNHPQAEHIYYAEELVRLYGTSISPEELIAYSTAERGKLIAEAETYIQTMPVFAEAGIAFFAAYEALREGERELTQVETVAHWALLGEECGYLAFYLQALEAIENDYITSLPTINGPNGTLEGWNEKEQTRYQELLRNGENHSIFSIFTYENTKNFANSFAILLMLSLMVFVSPLLVSDRHENMHHLQYASKLGRSILHRQLMATLLSTFLLTTLLIVLFGGIYSINGTRVFWNNNINSELNIGPYSVFTLTYGQWVTAQVILLYVLALAVSVLAFILSRFSRNLITMVMKLIPAFAAIALLCTFALTDLFRTSNAFYRILRIFGTEAYVCGFIAILALAGIVFVLRREKRVDVF